jgi:hypothetical protein
MPSMTGPSSFVFLNEAGTLENAAGWNDVRRSKLWLYNLHYFDDLSAPVDSQRTLWHRNLISRWIVGNPPGEGNGWEPYPLSIRIVNWIKWALTAGQRTRTAHRVAYSRQSPVGQCQGSHFRRRVFLRA